MPAVKWPNKVMAEPPTTLGKKMTMVLEKNSRHTKAKKPVVTKNRTKVTTNVQTMKHHLIKSRPIKNQLAHPVNASVLNQVTGQPQVLKGAQQEAVVTKDRDRVKAERVVVAQVVTQPVAIAKVATVPARVAAVQVDPVQVVRKNK